MRELVWLIPVLPLVGFLINGPFGKHMPKKAVALLACGLPLASFALSVAAYFDLQAGKAWTQNVYTWIDSGAGFVVDFGLRIDQLSTVMILVVTGVGFLIHVYSYGYMKHDPGLARYYAYLNLFMFSMLLLVLADSLPLMFVGWEGVGLCSYLLIGFWYQSLPRADAGKKAFIVNRVGDLAFLLGMFILFGIYNTLNFEGMAAQRVTASLTLPCLLLFIGASGKSAQIPLYVWLPDAMAGPTPVSALIHAATMVTAGVYMIARLHFAFALAPQAMEIIGLVTGATALFAGLMAMPEFNLKKVLAYSTISQLGFMFCGVASLGFTAGMFHLVTHAFFKALLFLGAGAVIHHLANEEDMRKMGGLRKHMPLTFWCFMIGGLALAGVFPFAGFWSKEEILGSVFHRAETTHHPVWWAVLGMLGATTFVTAFYTFRMITLTFFGHGHPHHGEHHEKDYTMPFALVVLLLLTIGGGALAGPLASFLPYKFEAHHGKEILIGSLGLAGLGILTVWLMYGPWKAVREKLAATNVAKLASKKFYVDELYEYLFVLPMNMTAFVLWLIVDRLIIDTLLVNGSAQLVYKIGQRARALQSGVVNAALTVVGIGALAVLAYLGYLVHLMTR